MTANHLAQGALFCGVLALVACFLTWATPRRSLADLQAEAYRAKADGDESGPGTLVEETRRAFDVSLGAKSPRHLRKTLSFRTSPVYTQTPERPAARPQRGARRAPRDFVLDFNTFKMLNG